MIHTQIQSNHNPSPYIWPCSPSFCSSQCIFHFFALQHSKYFSFVLSLRTISTTHLMRHWTTVYLIIHPIQIHHPCTQMIIISNWSMHTIPVWYLYIFCPCFLPFIHMFLSLFTQILSTMHCIAVHSIPKLILYSIESFASYLAQTHSSQSHKLFYSMVQTQCLPMQQRLEYPCTCTHSSHQQAKQSTIPLIASHSTLNIIFYAIVSNNPTQTLMQRNVAGKCLTLCAYQRWNSWMQFANGLFRFIFDRFIVTKTRATITFFFNLYFYILILTRWNIQIQRQKLTKIHQTAIF